MENVDRGTMAISGLLLPRDSHIRCKCHDRMRRQNSPRWQQIMFTINTLRAQRGCRKDEARRITATTMRCGSRCLDLRRVIIQRPHDPFRPNRIGSCTNSPAHHSSSNAPHAARTSFQAPSFVRNLTFHSQYDMALITAVFNFWYWTHNTPDRRRWRVFRFYHHFLSLQATHVEMGRCTV